LAIHILESLERIITRRFFKSTALFDISPFLEALEPAVSAVSVANGQFLLDVFRIILSSGKKWVKSYTPIRKARSLMRRVLDKFQDILGIIWFRKGTMFPICQSLACAAPELIQRY
jgi:hypothetical protein